ncbi:RagB/SusD family nutrient uptake outer membrane protein [Flammeovirga sp. MY04]|uniref:RagB/SusD family nutrient uptake outer membrane protein n=1 Tax=Flammeovirga sp. MY04 TaxID=1191459 RepID=UPI00080624E8|nr:RagB/SusD family nutrient uptake outer membrane protein [Flammeovirga sp. MY04]ANQ49834.1 RagB/SusD family nutrient uptake outer membrane protein [Flammeovirga sp. MY04]
MKLKNILIAASLSTSLLIGCGEKFLDVQPTDQVSTEAFFASEADHEKALVGVYGILSRDYYEWTYQPLNMLSDLMSDDSYAGGGAGGSDQIEWQLMGQFNLTAANNQTTQAWKKCYVAIQRANTLINNFNSDVFSQKEAADGMLGEATMLRAHFYYELARHYENIVIVDLTAGESEITQSPVDETYAYIAKDMLDAIELLPDSQEHGSGRLDKWGATAELAKMFVFYTGYYKKDALPVLDGQPITRTDMIRKLEDLFLNSGRMLEADYATLWGATGDWTNESLFEIPHADTGWDQWQTEKLGNMGCQMAGPRGYKVNKDNSNYLTGGWGFGIPSKELVNAYEAGDMRKDVTIISAEKLLDDAWRVNPDHESGNPKGLLEVGHAWTGYFTFKYTTHASITPATWEAMNFPQNYVYIRLADMYLTAAILYKQEGNQGKADEYVNLIRARAGLTAKSNVTMDDIYDERRVELAMEGHRYFDVLGRGLEYAKQELDITNYVVSKGPADDPKYTEVSGGVFGDDLRGELGVPAHFEVTFDVAKKGFWPIPQSELDQLGSLKQNAGY